MHSMDLFSGIGGNAFAFRSFATPALYCEVDGTAVRILQAAMDKGYVPRAPVHGDVTTMLDTPLYAEAKLKRPLLITGSWPCQGNSIMGKGLGMADARSGLLRTFCDIVSDAQPDVFFAENVPGVLRNGSYEYLVEQLNEEYDVRHAVVRASDLGFRHERARFFCVGLRRGGRGLDGVFFESISRLLPRAAAEPERTRHARSVAWVDQMHALGNAVVPAASYYAFLTLTGQEVPGLPGTVAAQLALVFDPNAYAAPAGRTANRNQRHEALAAPRNASRWSTPRAGACHPCHTLSVRTVRDLATQVRFERGTPDESRAWLLNAAWVCWLMGFPDDYTDVPGEARTAGAAGAFRARPSEPRRGTKRSAAAAAKKLPGYKSATPA